MRSEQEIRERIARIKKERNFAKFFWLDLPKKEKSWEWLLTFIESCDAMVCAHQWDLEDFDFDVTLDP